jgi:maltooligosyltrehalose trehalohydrolase
VSYMTGARQGYLGGFGELEHIQKALAEGFVYDGSYSAYRGRRFGSSSKDEQGERFVAFLQNHDQVANTAQGRRLSELVPLEKYKLAVALLLASPYLPLLFMGEEFAETSPFLYFTSHTDPALARAVTEGRRKEFEDFLLAGEVSDEFPDPQSPETFRKSKITWALAGEPRHAAVLRLYRDLIALRKRWPCLANCRKDLVHIDTDDEEQWLTLNRKDPDGSSAFLLCNFGPTDRTLSFDTHQSDWQMVLWTGAANYGGNPAHPPPAEIRKSSEPTVMTVAASTAVLYLQRRELSA